MNTIDGGQDAIAAGTRDALITPSTGAQPGNVTTLYANPANGAFTFEAIVRLDFDPTKNFGTLASGGNGRNTTPMIISGESTASANRVFQFRILPIGVAGMTTPSLSFENVRQGSAAQSISAMIPTTGPDAIEQDGWYHAAVTYNGVPNTVDNISFYWTRVDPDRVAANKIAITSATTTCSGLVPASSGATPIVIGNEARNRTSNFLGLIDEVRISSVARDAADMLFTSPAPAIITNPSDVTVAVGQSATFSVAVGGSGQLNYQWRHDNNPIPGATRNVYTISSVVLTNAGSYDVVVTNEIGSATSSSATLTARNPANLLWTGAQGFDWEYTTQNWIDSSSSLSANYGIGDHVRFDDTAAGFVNLTASLSPSSVTVDSTADYTFVTFNGGRLTGDSRLIKNGSGKLVLETDHSYKGSTTISNGTIEIGVNTSAGSLGTGPVTNNGVLIFNRTGSVSMGNFHGSGSLINEKNAGITITGTNNSTGKVTLNAGALFLSRAQAGGDFGTITLNATANASGFSGTRLSLSGGITNSANLNLLGSSAAPGPDLRCTIASASETNALNGPITLGGGGPVQFISESLTGAMIVNSAITGDYTGGLTLRGGGNGTLNSVVNLPTASVNKTDSGVWTITSTGNVWTNSNVSFGTLRLGANNALPSNVSVTVGQPGAGTAVFDLGGFNQTIAALRDGGGNEFIGNSSTNSDSTLTLASDGTWSFGGTMQDAAGTNGNRKLSFTLNGGSLTLRSNNTYTGDTTIQSGSIILSGVGNLSGSANLILHAGATLDASARTDGTLALSASQTLKGSGTLQVNGILSSSGTIELKVNKSGSITHEMVSGPSQIIYGGTLKLILSGDALIAGDSMKLFDATAYSGEFANFNPATPGAGLLWDTSTLATDGVLRVKVGNLTPPAFSSMSVVGTNLVLGGSGGNPGSSYTVLSSTNVATPLVDWTVVKTGSFDGNGNFSETIAMTPAATCFYLLRLP